MLDSAHRFLLRAVAELSDSIVHEGSDHAPHVLDIDALFDRCLSEFKAIAVLLEHEHGSEAIMIGRALFTDSLLLAELAAADEQRRAQLMVGRSLQGVASLEGAMRGREAQGEDLAEELGWVALARSNVEKYARDLGVGTAYWRPNEKTLAEEHGRGPEYFDFQLGHLFVHGGLGGAMRRHGMPDDHEALPHGTEPDGSSGRQRRHGLPAGQCCMHAGPSCRFT